MILGILWLGVVMRLVDLGNDTGSDGLSALSKGETRARLQSDVVNKVSDHLDVVTGHDLETVRLSVADRWGVKPTQPPLTSFSSAPSVPSGKVKATVTSVVRKNN